MSTKKDVFHSWCFINLCESFFDTAFFEVLSHEEAELDQEKVLGRAKHHIICGSQAPMKQTDKSHGNNKKLTEKGDVHVGDNTSMNYSHLFDKT